MARDSDRLFRTRRAAHRLLTTLPRVNAPASPAPDPYDFSVVIGGPLYQLARRAHLSDDALEMVRRRLVVLTLVTWLPLPVLSMIDGRAWGSAVAVPFVADLETHVRLLLALPLLIVAELVVHRRMRPVVRQFLERGLVAEPSLHRFDTAILSAMRLRNSVVTEVLLLAAVYVIGFALWPLYGALEVTTWYAVPSASGRELSLAGWWFALVSLPVFQFLLLRWYFRLFVWTRFLWHVSRCRLSLVPTHPDRVGGLGFLPTIVIAFAPLLVAHGTLLASSIAARILFQGATLPAYAVEVGVVVGFLLVVVLGPLLVFTPHLEATRRVGLREYGTLAQRYVRAFDDKWLRRGAADGEPLIGSADIQSLADLDNAFEIVRTMRMVPFAMDTVVQLVLLTLLPVVPLVLTIMPIDRLLLNLLKVVL